MNIVVSASTLSLVLLLCGCDPPAPPGPVERTGPVARTEPVESGETISSGFDTVLVVLGNEPLDDATPTVDTVARVTKAVEFQKEHPASLLVFTGGPTAGNTSEARMMADLAIAQGVPEKSIRLEEKARSTSQNASLTARLIRQVNPRRVLIVSKADHLEWAMPRFKRFPEFRKAEPLASTVDRADSIAQMEAYLKEHDSARVRSRLGNLEKGVKGVD